MFILEVAHNICIFDEKLIAKQWTLDYTVTFHQYFNGPSAVICNPYTSEVAEKKLLAH